MTRKKSAPAHKPRACSCSFPPDRPRKDGYRILDRFCAHHGVDSPQFSDLWSGITSPAYAVAPHIWAARAGSGPDAPPTSGRAISREVPHPFEESAEGDRCKCGALHDHKVHHAAWRYTTRTGQYTVFPHTNDPDVTGGYDAYVGTDLIGWGPTISEARDLIEEWDRNNSGREWGPTTQPRTTEELRHINISDWTDAEVRAYVAFVLEGCATLQGGLGALNGRHCMALAGRLRAMADNE